MASKLAGLVASVIYLIPLLLVLFIILFPGWWVKHTLKKYSIEYDELPGTGGELAKHLIERLQLPVSLEQTDQGDHYDPQDKTVRLTESFYNGRSLSAVAVAAHEVGHAIQDHSKYKLLRLRTQLVKVAQHSEKVGSLMYLLLPLMTVLSRSPVASGGMLLLAVGAMSFSVLVHLVTLPVEWDASFKRALPLLEQGEYLTAPELKVAKKILLAAALTYVAGALMSLVNVWRWIRILRMR
ncbi:zinc metallopeptidase [Pleionea mediterranea]|uniref:zinc metallopeptidase n=1 Tax=Pleionea mediterranea TaxID=523701 RepID=UPI001FE131EE|nr:zinc metallopeptidase [Pleionea mediterranea]